MAKGNSRQSTRKTWKPNARLSKRLRSYFVMGSTLMGASGSGVAQQAPRTGVGDLPPGYTVYPVNYQFQENCCPRNQPGVSQEFDVTLGPNQTVAFKFSTYYANSQDVALNSSWRTIQAWINPVKNVSATLYTKSWDGNRFVSHACDSAIIANVPHGPGIRGDHGWMLSGAANYLDYHRNTFISICGDDGCTPRTSSYSAGHWGPPSDPSLGAIPIFIHPGVLDGTQHYGWITVSLNRGSTALTIGDVIVGPGESAPATISGSGCSGPGSTQTSSAGGQPASESKMPLITTRKRNVLQVPLPDGSVPLTLGLLATGEQGVSLWRRTESMKRNFLESRQ